MYRTYEYKQTNPIIEELKEQARNCADFGIRITRKALELEQPISATYTHIPCYWLRFGYSTMYAQARLYPMTILFKVNVDGMEIKREGDKKYTLFNPENETEIKLVFH